jgi:hypothetical protein
MKADIVLLACQHMLHYLCDLVQAVQSHARLKLGYSCVVYDSASSSLDCGDQVQTSSAVQNKKIVLS